MGLGLEQRSGGRTRVLVADDHEIFRRGLRSLLESRPELEVCGEAANGLEAVQKAEELLPDVIIMDISMPYANGLEATRRVLANHPEIRVLILSQHDSALMLSAAMEAGAVAYVTKSQVAQCLLSALEGLRGGQPFTWNAHRTDLQPAPAKITTENS